MGRMSGADADELDRLGHHMQGAAERLEAIRAEVTAAFNRTHWEGGDADHFRGQWNYRLSGLLHTAVTATRQASTTLQRNANEQRIASGTDSGSLRGPLIGGGGAANAASTAGLLATGIAIGTGATNVLGPLSTLQESIERLGENGSKLKIVKDLNASKAFKLAGNLGTGIAVAGLVFDGADFIHGLATNPHDPANVHKGVDTAFDVAEIATAAVGMPYLSLGLAGVHMGVDLAWDAWDNLDPHTKQDIVHGVEQAASVVADVAGGTVHAVEGAAGAAGNVVSGGVNAVRNFIHW